MTALEALRYDAAALISFVNEVSLYCRTGGYPSYASPSEELFEYISDLASSTKSYISDFVATIDSSLAQSDPQSFYLQTQVLWLLRFSWFQVHRFVKPAADADTLHAPNSLMVTLTNSITKLVGFENVRFSVLHSTELNYFQINSNYLRDLVTQISAIVRNTKPFPNDLGVVAIPYSQSSAVFSNVLLAHEMGHFAFQRRGEVNTLSATALAKLQASRHAAQLGPLLIWCKDRIVSWCEEIFCDLFALALVGPCFSLAYIELFGLTRNAALTAGGLVPGVPNPQVQFAASHPANALRLRQHVRFMQSEMTGWWDELRRVENHMVELLERAAGIDDSDFLFNMPNAVPESLDVSLEVFLEMVGDVHQLVADIFAGAHISVDDFKRDQELVQRYLSFAVVPSLLTEAGIQRKPSQLTVLNASYLFYLNSLGDLMEKVESCDQDDLQSRSYWAGRVEKWTAKALDDLRG